VIKKIDKISGDPVIDLALDTIKIGKQALVFVNTKRSAEHCAEKIAEYVKQNSNEKLVHGILTALPKPTKQCQRLAKCITKGVAFHHAGLHAKQRELVEDAFRNGTLKIICCTTTMAAGMDLPAFRSIIRDLRRYGRHGLEFIPILEYHQAAGRAGRPGKEEFGEAIVIAHRESEIQEIADNFINAEPEPVFSKLAVEPVLRTYLLSLIATNVVGNEEELVEFFSKTFWAMQYEDIESLKMTLMRIKEKLIDWGFLKRDNANFISGTDYNKKVLRVTRLGKRISELYLDPLTAHLLVEGLDRAKSVTVTEFSLLQLICSCLELRPLLKPRAKEFDKYQEFLGLHEDELLTKEPSFFEEDYEEFMATVKTTAMLMDWIDEKDDEVLMEEYNTRPGETRYKLEIADWLLYALKELGVVLKNTTFNPSIEKLRIRLKYGVREELVPLLKLKKIGKIRARALYNNNIRSIKQLKKTDPAKLRFILGNKIAEDIIRQLGSQNENSKLSENI